MDLVWAEDRLLPSYVDALRRGWSPNTGRPEASAEELYAIEANRGELLDAFSKPGAYGGQSGVRYRIHLG